MNKHLIEKQFVRSLSTYEAYADAQQQIIRHFFDLLGRYLPSRHQNILEIGAGTGMATRYVENAFDYEALLVNDFNSVIEHFQQDFQSRNKTALAYLPGDIELIDIKQSFDLIISTSTEQWIQEKELFYRKMWDALKPEGYFVFTSFGQENLKEIYQATNTGLNYLKLKEQEQLLHPYFKTIYVEEQGIHLYFKSVKLLMQHLKNTGVNGIRQHAWRKKEVLQMLDKIEKCTFVGDNNYMLTYHPYYFILQKKSSI